MESARKSWSFVAAVSVLAALLMLEIARLTIAQAVAQDDPQLAARLAPHSPASLTASAMAQVGIAAAKGGDPDKKTFEQLRDLAHSAPLQTEPFLVQAALAERAGDLRRASALLTDARMRDPRSIAAHFLSADVATRQGDIVGGLREIAVLSRLVPGTAVKLVPGLSEFVKLPGSQEKLAGVLADNPQLKDPLLTALADDPNNADLIVSLAGPHPTSLTLDTRAWQSRLLTGLANRGEYKRAYQLWRHFAGIEAEQLPLLYNGSFRELPAPPPFNWSLTTSAAGVTEPGPKKLRVLFYGREDMLLASQLVVLPPGKYRFQFEISGSPVQGALSWSLSCVGSNSPVMKLAVGPRGGAAIFAVPETGCPAQTLQLNGHAQESPQDTDVRVGPAEIDRVPS